MEFEQYASARWPALYRTALLLTGNTAEAEDLAQQTMVKVYASWAKVRGAESPDAYVRRMLVNELTTDRRRGARRSLIAVPGLTEETVLAVDPGERLDLWRQIQMLPPRQRAVLVLRFYEDLTEAETARTLGSRSAR